MARVLTPFAVGRILLPDSSNGRRSILHRKGIYSNRKEGVAIRTDPTQLHNQDQGSSLCAEVLFLPPSMRQLPACLKRVCIFMYGAPSMEDEMRKGSAVNWLD